MKKRILCVWFLIFLFLCNSVCVFATEVEENGEDVFEDTIDSENYYPFQAFADRTIPGISVDASVEEGVFPSGTTMNVMTVSSDMKKQIEETVNEFFNDNKKVVELIAVDIIFLNNDVIINPKDGKNVHLTMCSDTVIEGKEYVIVCFKDDKSIEIIPSTETISTDLTVDDGETLNKKRFFSFDIKESSTYAIVEIEDETIITDNTDINQNEVEKTETSAEQNELEETEASAGQNEVEETETSAEQIEAEETKTSVDQNEVKEARNVVETKESDKTETSIKKKETKKSETSDEPKKTDETETSTEHNNEKEAKMSVERNEKMNISVHIMWEDVDNYDGIRPESVSFKLLANGKKVEEILVTEKDDWKYSFENLPKYQSGKEIVYTIKQKTIKGYETEKRGFDIINKHAPETIKIEGVIMWDDSSNKDGIRPKSIDVNLIVDGNIIDTAKVSRKSKWKYSFDSLPKYEFGKEIVYTVEEEHVEGYKSPQYYGFNIINVHEAGTLNKSDSERHSDGEPKVGDSNIILLWIICFILSVSAIIGIIVIRRKK